VIAAARYAGRGAPLLAGIAVAMTALPGPAIAVCSVFDGKPCTPYFCGIHDGASCTPEIFYPLNPDARRTFRYQNAEGPVGGPPTTPINTLAEFYGAIERCWRPPPLEFARPGMEITVLVTFKRSGELMGKPRITYETPDASDRDRLAYRTAMADSIARCTPLPFTDGFGNAQAGRPSRIRFIDHRHQKKAELNV
jgi:hypothetical protein